MDCPYPKLDGADIDGMYIGSGITAIGRLAWNNLMSHWQCAADVHGKLCLVQVKVTPRAEVSCTT